MEGLRPKNKYLDLRRQYIDDNFLDLPDSELFFAHAIFNREYELEKLSAASALKLSNIENIKFPSWFPEALREKILNLSSNHLIGRAISLIPFDVVSDYFNNINLKGYWRSIAKLSPEFHDIKLAWAIKLPLYCYLLASHEKNKVNEITKKEFQEKADKAAKLAKQLYGLIEELDCDISLPYLFLQSVRDDEKTLDVEHLNDIMDTHCNRAYLSDVLHMFGNTVDKLADHSDMILKKPNIESRKETYFVRVLCRFFIELYSTPFHEHTMNLVNTFFKQEFSQENIRSKTQNIRKSGNGASIANDDFNIKGELMHSFLDDHFLENSVQFYMSPQNYEVYAGTDGRSIGLDYMYAVASAHVYDIVNKEKEECMFDVDNYLEKVHVNQSEE